MLQAKDGYLWFTTYRGIVRFDDKDGLYTNDASGILEDANG